VTLNVNNDDDMFWLTKNMNVVLCIDKHFRKELHYNN